MSVLDLLDPLDDDAPIRPGEIGPARRLLRAAKIVRVFFVVAAVLATGTASLMLLVTWTLGGFGVEDDADAFAVHAAGREAGAALARGDVVVVVTDEHVALVDKHGMVAGGFTRRPSLLDLSVPRVAHHVGKRVPTPTRPPRLGGGR